MKVVFVVQNSGSMCIIDPPGSYGTGGAEFCDDFNVGAPAEPQRFRVIRDFFAAAGGNTSVAIVPWALDAEVLPFRPATDGPPPEFDALPNRLGKLTNLQRALAVTKSFIEADALSQPADLRARVRYVVVVLSVGNPVRCSGDDALTDWASASHPEGVWKDAYEECNDPNTSELPGLSPAGDLNQNSQLFSLVDDIVGLRTQYGLGSVRVYGRFLMDVAKVQSCGPICRDVFGMPVDEAAVAGRWLMEQLSSRGGGNFVEPQPLTSLSMQGVDTAACP